jgi:hypothetical protein
MRINWENTKQNSGGGGAGGGGARQELMALSNTLTMYCTCRQVVLFERYWEMIGLPKNTVVRIPINGHLQEL